MISRRQLLKRVTAMLGAGAITDLSREFGVQPAHAQAGHRGHTKSYPGAATSPRPSRKETRPSRTEARRYTPVVTPDGSTLPWKWEDGFKTFHLVAEPVKREFTPGLEVNAWGYNGQTPGPTIEVVEGDKVRIYVTNRLPEPTSVHWHGVFLPNGMDGVAGLNQRAIPPGDTFKYEFRLRQHGTFMYHPHFDEMVQMAMGMQGFFIVHPKVPEEPRVDRDFALMLNEWFIKPGTATPDPTAMSEFNLLTFNSRVFPGTAPLVVRKDQRVRVRLGNLSSMDAHPIHLHGYRFWVTATDGGQIPRSAWWPETTVLVPVGSTRDVQWVADTPGDWAFHCHITHHVMNQMGHGNPNLLGIRPAGVEERLNDVVPGTMLMGHTGMGEMHDMGAPRNSIPMQGGQGPFGRIDMGGMFTIVKVREGITSYEDPTWYKHPQGTVAESVAMRNAGEDSSGPKEYVCPMHSEVVQNRPGECPKCGMSLEPKHH
jgi:FtsP/CotA-like multicopper oxidase with cupredoxin domain